MATEHYKYLDATGGYTDPRVTDNKYLRADRQWAVGDRVNKFLRADQEWTSITVVPRLPPDLKTPENVLEAAYYAYENSADEVYQTLKSSLTNRIGFGSSGSAQFRLIGTDHDVRTDDKSKAELTFLAEECIGLSAMGPARSNTGGYRQSGTTMQTYLSNLFSHMDSAWKELVCPVDKEYGTDISHTSTMTGNNLWLPSANEMAITYSSYFCPKEGETYPYFAGEHGTGDSTKRIRDYNGAGEGYDLRSCYFNNVYFIYITYTGARNVSNATTSLGVVPGFCVSCRR